MDGLSSSAILKQLMLAAGGDNWVEYEENRRAQGLHSALGPDKKLTASIQPVTPTRSASSRKIRASAWLDSVPLPYRVTPLYVEQAWWIISLTPTQDSANNDSTLLRRDAASEKYNYAQAEDDAA